MLNLRGKQSRHVMCGGRQTIGSIRLVIAVSLLLVWNQIGQSQAQAEPGRIELGAKMAPSLEKHAGEREFAENTYKLGWSAGAELRYGLSDAWSLQVELLHATRGSDVESDGETVNTFNFRYIQLPVLAHYGHAIPGLTDDDGRPRLIGYIVAGPTLSVLLRAEDVDDRQFFPRSDVGSLDLSIMAGLGVAWRVGAQWSASVEVRFDRGFFDTFPETTDLETKNQAILLALGIGRTLNDGDGDGVANSRDRCSAEIEDWNDYQDADGCPDADNDKDGILVANDRCLEKPEDSDGFEDDDGCPDPDNDGDGFEDDNDKCPIEPFPRMKGCPPKLDRVHIEGDLLVLDPPLDFDNNDTKLGEEQELALDQVAELMTDYYPKMWLRLEGHADGEGKKEQNQKLSEQRAKAVVDYLEGKGIVRDRLVERGYGEDKPIRREEAEAGKRRNRRVELVIIEK